MHGLHLTADLRDCPVARAVMTDPAALRAACLRAVEDAGLHPVGELFHRYAPGVGVGSGSGSGTQASGWAAEAAGSSAAASGSVAEAPGPSAAAPVGITGVVLLAESHLAVHTWPELGAVTLDVYVCNFGADNSHRARSLLGALIAVFEPGAVERHSLVRGEVPA